MPRARRAKGTFASGRVRRARAPEYGIRPQAHPPRRARAAHRPTPRRGRTSSRVWRTRPPSPRTEGSGFDGGGGAGVASAASFAAPCSGGGPAAAGSGGRRLGVGVSSVARCTQPREPPSRVAAVAVGARLEHGQLGGEAGLAGGVARGEELIACDRLEGVGRRRWRAPAPPPTPGFGGHESTKAVVEAALRLAAAHRTALPPRRRQLRREGEHALAARGVPRERRVVAGGTSATARGRLGAAHTTRGTAATSRARRVQRRAHRRLSGCSPSGLRRGVRGLYEQLADNLQCPCTARGAAATSRARHPPPSTAAAVGAGCMRLLPSTRRRGRGGRGSTTASVRIEGYTAA